MTYTAGLVARIPCVIYISTTHGELAVVQRQSTTHGGPAVGYLQRTFREGFNLIQLLFSTGVESVNQHGGH
jgi:hypothetical protein